MTDTKGSGGEGRLMPPYVSFQSVKTAIAQFKEHVVPDRIDRSVLSNFSGAVGGQILTAFRFLGLTDASGHSTDRLRALVGAYETDAWASVLNGVLAEAYQPLFELNLQSCSPSQFTEKFRMTYQGADEVIRKSITFFLNAASDAKIPISSFIMKARKPRSGPSKRRPRAAFARGAEVILTDDLGEDDTESAPPHTPPPALQNTGLLDKLMEKFPQLDPAWPDDVKAKWFDAFTRLMETADGSKGSK